MKNNDGLFVSGPRLSLGNCLQLLLREDKGRVEVSAVTMLETESVFLRVLHNRVISKFR